MAASHKVHPGMKQRHDILKDQHVSPDPEPGVNECDSLTLQIICGHTQYLSFSLTDIAAILPHVTSGASLELSDNAAILPFCLTHKDTTKMLVSHALIGAPQT